MPANPHTYQQKTLTQYLLDNPFTFKPIIPAELQFGSSITANFSHPFWQRMCKLARLGKICGRDIINFLSQHHVNMGVGPYGEKRTHLYYQNSMSAASATYIHAGVDLIIPPYAPVFSPIDAEVIRVETSMQAGDYGQIVLLKHCLENIEFFTLYGHIESQVKLGDLITAGAIVGFIAEEKENGFWPPHLHFQLFESPMDLSACWGAVLETQTQDFLLKCPDPNLILQMEPPMKSLYLNDLCPDLDSARIKRWCVLEGAHIQKGELLLEFESMKVNLAINSPISGKIVKQLVQVGELIDRETPLITITAAG